MWILAGLTTAVLMAWRRLRRRTTAGRKEHRP